MTEPTSAQGLFKGRHFDQEIIVLCIRWYLTLKLSSRDLVQMMAQRGITLSDTTILRWVQQYDPEFEKRWNHCADHRRIKQRIRPMLGFKRFETAARLVAYRATFPRSIAGG